MLKINIELALNSLLRFGIFIDNAGTLACHIRRRGWL